MIRLYILLTLATMPVAAQMFGGSTPARKVTNATCTTGQVGTYDSSGKLSGCGSGGAGSTIKVGGTAASPARGSLNFTVGSGITQAISDNGTDTVVLTSTDTGVLLTNSNLQKGTPINCATTGTTTLTCTLAVAPALCADITTAGFTVRVIPGSTITGAATLAANGCSAISLRDPNGALLASGALVAGRPYTFVSDGALMIQQGGGAAAGGVDVTFSQSMKIRDDFCSGDAGRSITLGSNFGQLNWVRAAVGSAVSYTAGYIRSAAAPCGYRVNTGTTSGAGYTFTNNQDAGSIGGNNPGITPASQTAWSMYWPLRMNTSVATQAVAVGLLQTSGFNPVDCLVTTTNCIALIADTSVGTTFRLRSCASSTCTTTDTTVTFAADTNYMIKLSSTVAGTINVTINGAGSTNVSTNVPAGIMGPGFAALSRGTTRQVDFYGFAYDSGTTVTYP
jgi:hypothetical protein